VNTMYSEQPQGYKRWVHRASSCRSVTSPAWSPLRPTSRGGCGSAGRSPPHTTIKDGGGPPARMAGANWAALRAFRVAPSVMGGDYDLRAA
jgi:hypothetical protein